MPSIYLDHAATTPLDPDVRAEMQPWMGERFGNPSSRHPVGVRAAEAVDAARARIARAVGASAGRVVLTSGGTEANNLAVLGGARAGRRHGRHVLVGATEHASVRGAVRALDREGFEVEALRLTAGGELDLEDAAARLRPDTVLVAQMLANNEFGTVYPVRELARIVRARAPRARLHVDGVQALGKLECSPVELDADSVAVSAHKIHGPQGAGALVLGEGPGPSPLTFGGGQEQGLRPGTENVLAIVGFGAAAEKADRVRAEATRAMGAARAAFAEALGPLAGLRVLEPGSERLPSILALLVDGAPAEVHMHHLEARGVFVSTGSACSSRERELSPGLTALGLTADEARGLLRVSFSRESTTEAARAAAGALAEVRRELATVAP